MRYHKDYLWVPSRVRILENDLTKTTLLLRLHFSPPLVLKKFQSHTSSLPITPS